MSEIGAHEGVPELIDLVADLQAAMLGTTVARAHPPAMEWAALIANVRDLQAEVRKLRAVIDHPIIQACITMNGLQFPELIPPAAPTQETD